MIDECGSEEFNRELENGDGRSVEDESCRDIESNTPECGGSISDRILEDGEGRISEDGDCRIMEDDGFR